MLTIRKGIPDDAMLITGCTGTGIIVRNLSDDESTDSPNSIFPHLVSNFHFQSVLCNMLILGARSSSSPMTNHSNYQLFISE
jgi:hypothetical protein